MPSRDLLKLVAELAFVRNLKNEAIAQQLHSLGHLKSPKNVKKVAALLAEAGRWLLEEKKNVTTATVPRANAIGASMLKPFWPSLNDLRSVNGAIDPIPTWSTPVSEFDLNRGGVIAEYIDDVIGKADDNEEDAHIAICGGGVIFEAVSALVPKRRKNAHFYPIALLGRAHMRYHGFVSPEVNATIAWARSGAIPGRLHYVTLMAPEKVEDSRDTVARHEAARRSIIHDLRSSLGASSIKEMLALMSRVDVAIVELTEVKKGIPQEDLGMNAVLGPLQSMGVNPDLLVDEGVRGYLGNSFFGRDCTDQEGWRLFMTLGYPDGLGFYKNMVKTGRTVVAITTPGQALTVRSALEHGLYNVLITDIFTVISLMHYSETALKDRST